MYIQEAVKESLTSGKWIQRKSWLTCFAGKVMILPTNTHDCCIIGSLNYKTGLVENRSKYWNPKAEDLIADDWVMINDQDMTMTECIADLERRIKVIEKCLSERQGENHHTKTIGAKLVLKGADKFREELGGARSELEKYNDSMQIAIHNTEQLDKSVKEFGKINNGFEVARNSAQGLGEALEVQGVITANHISGSSLRRKEINMRTAAALMDFVEKVSSGKSSTGKNCPARDEEIAALPAVAKILLEISQRLPG